MMKRSTLEKTALALAVLLWTGCGGSTSPRGDVPDTSLDSETDTTMDVPADPVAEDVSGPACTDHEQCLDSGYCGPCSFYQCPCDPASDPGCDPRCMPNPCHDGTAPVCAMVPPVCPPYEVLTVVGGCWACLNVQTCAPWGEPGCVTDADCGPGQRCDDCARGSCPGCEDCVADCVEHGCPTEEVLECAMARPDCGPGAVSVIHDGCWVCVNQVTCLPWGEAECVHASRCPPDQWCNPCGTSSCPSCLDCIAACTPHGCSTEGEAFCDMVRPDCDEGMVSVIRDGCWVCVSMDDCT